MSELETSASRNATTPAASEETARSRRTAETPRHHGEGVGPGHCEDHSAVEYCVHNDLI